MNKYLDDYFASINARVGAYKSNKELQNSARSFFDQIGIGKADYVYNFTWAGIPILQIPQDLQAMQEIIWKVKPEVIVDVGIAWGGTLMFNASMLAMLEACGEIENGRVIGVDVDIRPHNLKTILSHPLSNKIALVEGSSIDQSIVKKVYDLVDPGKRVLLCLDSNHTHSHVLSELEFYTPLVSVGSYCIVGDTIIEDAPLSMTNERPWGPGNSPKSAVWEFLQVLSKNPKQDRNGDDMNFVIDHHIEDKIVLTGSPDGYLHRIS